MTNNTKAIITFDILFNQICTHKNRKNYEMQKPVFLYIDKQIRLWKYIGFCEKWQMKSWSHPSYNIDLCFSCMFVLSGQM